MTIGRTYTPQGAEARIRFKRIRGEMLESVSEVSEWWAAMPPDEVNATHPALPRMLAQLNMAAGGLGDPENVDMNGLQESLWTPWPTASPGRSEEIDREP